MSLSFIRSLRGLTRSGVALGGTDAGSGASLKPSDLLVDLRDAAASGGASDELFDPQPGDLLTEAIAIGRSLHTMLNFGEALAYVADRLSPMLGARSVVRLRVQGQDGAGFLVRPWSSGDTRHQEWINLNQLAVVPGLDVPLGMALVRGTPWSGLPTVSDVAWPWRTSGLAGVLCLPVLLDGQPVAVLEWQAVQRATPAMMQALELVGLQLSEVLRREPVPANRLAALAWMQFAGQPEAHDEPDGRALAVSPKDVPGSVSRWMGPLFAALLETIPQSLMVLDATDYTIVSFNRHAKTEFGVDDLAGPGQNIDDLLGADVALQLLPLVEQAILQPHAIEDEFHWLTVHGPRHVLAWQAAVRDNTGEAMFVLVQLRDITAQKHEEIKQIETELRFKELIESIDGGVFVTTPVRDHYAYMGARVLEIFGVPHEEFRRDPNCLRQRVLTEDLPLLDSHRASEESLHQSDVSFRVVHPARGVRWLRQRTRARELSNGDVRVYGFVDDVTDEREREQLLHQARDSAEAASQAKSQFLANMSHEIRTPMNGILGMTEILLGTSLTGQQKRCAQAVYSSGESLLEIIDDILDFAKVEAGRLELESTDFSLRMVVEDTLELLAQRAHEKGLELSFREAEALPALVCADPLRLRQVLTNLVANAIKFTESGEVVVELRLLQERRLEARPAGAAELRFECVVRDTGIGIAADAMPRLFSSFTQVHGGMSRRYGGTGLGLAISRQLVELMGGEVSVNSEPGVGSEFRFTFDAKTSTEVAPSLADDMAMPTLRVLLVEDNATSRAVLQTLLQAWGLKVTVATDGQHALELLRALHPEDAPFDLALVDWRMPRMDGIGFARNLRLEGLQPQMRLLLLSSVSAPDDVRLAQDAGYRRFIHKPVRKGELREALLGMTATAGTVEDLVGHLALDILVVEDNPVNQEVMEQMLHQLGCRTRIVASAQAGLDVLAAKRFDVVLMDIQMPGMDGLEALSWIRRGGRGEAPLLSRPDVRVVAVTANAMAGDEERFLAQGFDAYLSKPFRSGQLHEVLLSCVAADSQKERASAPASSPAWSREASLNARRSRARAGRSGLDPEAYQRLQALGARGDGELVPRVLTAFNASIDTYARTLDECSEADLPDRVRHVVHTLKSSAGSVGALSLAQACEETEAMLRAGNVERVLRDRLGLIRDEMAKARRDVAAELSALSPTAAGSVQRAVAVGEGLAS